MSERDLSCFFVKELYPLYSEDSIDAQRKTQVKSHLGSCKECKSYYEKLDKARLRISLLKETKVSSAMIAYLKEEHHFWTDLSKKLGWKLWPATIKWAIELSLVTAILVSTIHFFPWLRFARVVKRYRPTPQTAVAVKEVPKPTIEPTPVATVSIAAAVPTASPTMAPAGTPVVVAKVEEKPFVDAASSDEESTQTAGVDDGKQKAGGFVWRGNMKVDELSDDVAAKITKTILDLGGTKAGQVELGWHRGNQRYYHFILPEENYEKFLSVLNQAGIVQLTQERHPRTIREGHMRIIMTLEESGE